MGYRIQGLVKRYNDRAVLDVPALEIYDGERLAVVGPSGAGKSTLLRILHFLEQPTSGSVAYSHDGAGSFKNAGLLSLGARRRIGMVFQRPETIHGSVRENVALGLRFREMMDERKVMDAMDQLDIGHLANEDVGRLSGGELQRVALARVLAVQPNVVLFDEPTANLDPANVLLVEEIVRRMNEAGATIVLVTHNIFQAKRLADRVAFLLEGKLIEVSDAETFFNAPEDKRSLAFVQGEMIY